MKFFGRTIAKTSVAKALKDVAPHWDAAYIEFMDPINPFSLGMSGKVVRGSQFFGRTKELQKLTQATHCGGDVILTGLPRSGKSSVLRKFAEVTAIQQKLKVVELTGEMLSGDEGRVRDEIEQSLGLVGTRGSKTLAAPTLLCFDEYQLLFQRFPMVAMHLRGLSQRFDLRMAVAWHEEAVSFDADRYAVNAAKHISISSFEKEEIIKLCKQYLVDSHVTFDAAEIDRIWALSDGHPQRVQIAGYYLFESKVGRCPQWEVEYQSYIDEALNFFVGLPKHQRPHVDTIEAIRSILDCTLRKSFRQKVPANEAEIRDMMDVILTAAGFNFKLETPQLLFSMKGFRPDLSSDSLSIYVEAKLCNASTKVKPLVEEMLADIIPYKKNADVILFVVYDTGGFLQDPLKFAKDFEDHKGVYVHICKQ